MADNSVMRRAAGSALGPSSTPARLSDGEPLPHWRTLCTPMVAGVQSAYGTCTNQGNERPRAAAGLADVINAAGMHDQITFVTSRGRRVAAVVSVAIAEGVRRKPGSR